MSTYRQLTDYGICNPVYESIEETSNSPTGYLFEADKLIFTEKADKLKISRGLVFGISYHLESDQDAFLSRIVHPILVNPITGKRYKETTEEKYVSSIGLNFDYYRLENSWEMIAGKWTFQVEQFGKVLLVKSFDLYD